MGGSEGKKKMTLRSYSRKGEGLGVDYLHDLMSFSQHFFTEGKKEDESASV